MELFTEVEFLKEEFDKIDKVLSCLKEEGWSIFDTQEHTIKKPNQLIEIIAKKYRFRRVIN